MTFSVRRGTNISHWLSQSKARGPARRAAFTSDDVSRIRDAGLDHVRLPVDEEQLWSSGEIGMQIRDEEAFELLNKAIDQSEAAGLRVIVDLHILRSHYFQNKNPTLFTDRKEADRFGWLWADLSAALSSRDESKVAYELLNEAVAGDHADWNRVYPHALSAIRQKEPTRTVILGSNKWNQCWTYDALAVPANDPHLILTFHYYNPMLITHYRASWAEKVRDYTGPVHYPGRPIAPEDWAALPDHMRKELQDENEPYDSVVMERDIAKPLAVAARTGLKLYCGEFGVYHSVPDPTRIAWYRDFRNVLERHQIGWGNWDYRGGFGLIDKQGKRTAAWTGLLG